MVSYVWSLVAIVLGSPARPTSMDQFWVWINNCLLNEKQFHMMGLAAILWALWRARSSACFKKKLARSPTENICSACSSIVYWTGLQKGDDQKRLEDGAEVLKEVTLQGVQQRKMPEILLH